MLLFMALPYMPFFAKFNPTIRHILPECIAAKRLIR
ncbi:hypothetical protein C8J27_101218 [Rhodobacter aestuarii]|uniref:Uncharacterized protein n=1 Tax=Rhodobacter aestuarii TaxID=453582 RepID=A0A1N7J771_9RHOB|nr:hypothetical protein C8J27_101218 [Rhodobacter aestuarii]SIS45162.1 hypothetical protein SAMN05421580_101424 [Rhodobacter aestuarii]SOB98544.1 hypothetical protein SAMN05877809_102278 [Rhodobacter sp. JA431]